MIGPRCLTPAEHPTSADTGSVLPTNPNVPQTKRSPGWHIRIGKAEATNTVQTRKTGCEPSASCCDVTRSEQRLLLLVAVHLGVQARRFAAHLGRQARAITSLHAMAPVGPQ